MTKPLRILISAYTFGPGQGSEGANSWGLCQALAKHGHHVTVLTTTSSAEAAREALADAPLKNLRFEGVDIPAWAWKLPSSQVRVYVLYAAWQWAIVSRAAELVDEQDIDVVHHMTWGSLQLGTQLWRLDRPLVFGPCGGGQTAPEQLRGYYVGRWANEGLRSAITRHAVPAIPFARQTAAHADRVLVNNRDTAALATELGATDVQFGNEIGLRDDQLIESPPTRSSSTSALNLIWAGRLMPRKGAPLALKAMQLVPAHLDVHLTMCGYGWQEDQIQSWIDELGIGKRVTFTGRIPYEQMVEQYANADALLFTSLRDSSGAQLLEAMGQGLPVITLDLHGAAVLVPDEASIKVQIDGARTAKRVAQAITQLAGDPERRRKMSHAAWEFAQSQRWEELSLSYVDHYRDVIAAREAR